ELPERGVVGTGSADDAAALVPRAAAGGAALVDAVHRLGDEVLGQVAGVGQRPVVAARAGEALAGRLAARGAVPVVGVVDGGRIGLVGERQQLDQVVVVDLPVELAAPEVVVAVGVPGLAGVDVARIAVALLVHREEEQAVLQDRARRPHVGLVERGVVAAAAVALVDGAVLVELVLPGRGPGIRLDGELGAGVELVAARAGHGVDHAAGAAAELGRVAAGLDLELLVERERHRRVALATVRVGDVEAVDVDHVLGHRGTAEAEAAEGGARVDDARRQQRNRAQALVHGQARQLLAGDVGGGLGRVHVHAVDYARADHLHGGQVDGALRVEVDLGGAAQRDGDRDRRARPGGQGVLARRQLADAVVAVLVDRHRARHAGRGAGDRDLGAGFGLARHGTGDALRHHRHGQGREAHAHRHAEYGLAQVAGARI